MNLKIHTVKKLLFFLLVFITLKSSGQGLPYGGPVGNQFAYSSVDSLVILSTPLTLSKGKLELSIGKDINDTSSFFLIFSKIENNQRIIDDYFFLPEFSLGKNVGFSCEGQNIVIHYYNKEGKKLSSSVFDRYGFLNQ